MQYRFISCNHQVCIVGKYNNSINRNSVAKDKSQKRLYVAFVLPDGISQLMFLSRAAAFVAYARQVLFPKFGMAVSIHFSMNIFSFQHKYTISGNNDMVYLGGVFSVPYQNIIVNTVVFAIQILQE